MAWDLVSTTFAQFSHQERFSGVKVPCVPSLLLPFLLQVQLAQQQ